MTTTTATARRTAKNNMFILTNDNFARASRFVHFVHMYDMKLTNFTSPVYGLCEHSTISHFRLKVSVLSGPNWNLEVLIFEKRGKTGVLEKPLGAKERTNNKLNLHNYGRWRRNLNPGHIGGWRVFSLMHPCSSFFKNVPLPLCLLRLSLHHERLR